MPLCSFADGAAMFDVTPIENLFLLEYLPTAPEDFLRVYLYARMLSLHPELGGDLGSMAKALRIEEDTVYDAFSYWERQGLVRRLTDRPPTYEMLPLRAEGAAACAPMERDYYEYREFNAALQTLFGSNLLHPQEYRTANDWLNILGFEQEAVLRMVEHELKRSRSKKPDRLFKKLNKQAAVWADRGVRTAADVEREIAFDEQIFQTAQAVMKQFAINRQPTVNELECVRRWIREWNYTLEEILDACKETTKSRAPSFAYLDAILKSRRSGEGELREGLVEVLRELDAPNAQPTPDQLRSYGALLSAGFEPATIKLAAIQCHRKKKNRFEELEWMLGKWRELQLFTLEAAESYVRDMQRKTAEVRILLERCGLERRPMMDDLAMYEAWSGQYPAELIGYAADCARGMQLPMRYIDRLLGEWHKSGVTTVDAARAQHEANRKAHAMTPAPANPALNYEQRTYTDDDFGEDFFIDLEREYGNGGGENDAV